MNTEFLSFIPWNGRLGENEQNAIVFNFHFQETPFFFGDAYSADSYRRGRL